jgi:hypothetical protein
MLVVRSKLGFIASVTKSLNPCHSGDRQNPGKQYGYPRPTACRGRLINACLQLDRRSSMADVSWIMVGLLIITLFSHLSCANSNANKFHNKISCMSDTELLAYYFGINGRLKDLEQDMGRPGSVDRFRVTDKHYIYQTPFSAGGEGYHLIRNRKMILEELRRRNIHPHAATID